MSMNDFDPLRFHEDAARIAEANYAKNPLDVKNLINWAGVLLELSYFQNSSDMKPTVQDAIKKLEEALVLNPPVKHVALWYLGNAYSSIALLDTTLDEAKVFFHEAAQYYKQAYDLEPENKEYKECLMEAEAGKVHLQEQIDKRGLAQQAMASGPSSTITKPAGSEEEQKYAS